MQEYAECLEVVLDLALGQLPCELLDEIMVSDQDAEGHRVSRGSFIGWWSS